MVHTSLASEPNPGAPRPVIAPSAFRIRVWSGSAVACNDSFRMLVAGVPLPYGKFNLVRCLQFVGLHLRKEMDFCHAVFAHH